MPIVTNFSFHHRARAAAPLTAADAAAADLLGPLRGFVGQDAPPPGERPMRKWAGQGFNMIWRPQFGAPADFFLQLMFTSETLTFTDITGSGIANRGFKQADVFLGGAAYLQEISDSFDGSGQHFEPGVWGVVPATSDPREAASVVRMGSIPHGATINLQGQGQPLANPDMSGRIPPASIVPFRIGSVDDGQTNLVHFAAEETLASTGASRTDLGRVEALTQDQLSNPNRLLVQANAGLIFDTVTEIAVASDPNLVTGPDVGGGVGNIAFLEGKGDNDANADTPVARATFWLQTGHDASGAAFVQLQYTQRVLLNFNGLSWPHITVGTLRPC